MRTDEIKQLQQTLTEQTQLMLADLVTRFQLPRDQDNSGLVMTVADEFLVQVEREFPHGSDGHVATLCNTIDLVTRMRTALRNL